MPISSVDLRSRGSLNSGTQTAITNNSLTVIFSRYRFGIGLVLAILIFAGHVHLKTTKIFSHPTWDAQDDTGQFWSEFAVHYRFAKFFAEHPIRDWGQLTRDRHIQYPDEINSWSEFTIAMEVPVGAVYRWLRPAMPFHEWVVWYSCLVSSLALFGVFFLARVLWRSDWAGILATLLYATTYPSYGRTVRNLFPREDFAIPLILFALLFTIQAIRQNNHQQSAPSPQSPNPKAKTFPIHELLAGLFWLAALASWHLTQFLLFVLIGAIAIHFLWRSQPPRLPWMIAVLAIGGVLVPLLNEKQFYLSPAMCVLYGMACVAWAGENRVMRYLVFVSTTVLFLLFGWLAQTTYGEYSHVYQLFFAKLKFLGVKPDDPTALPFHARSLWEGAFNTAPLGEFWRSLKWNLPLSLIVLLFAFTGPLAPQSQNLKLAPQPHPSHASHSTLHTFLIFTLLLFPLSWMVIRYFTFLGFAAASTASGIAIQLNSILNTAPSPKTQNLKPFLFLLLLIALIWQAASLDRKPLPRGSQPTPVEFRPVIKWIQQNTTPDTVILATIADSPVYLAHTGRPIVMHSKFENERIRLRWQEMLEAIYGSEENFHAFARKYGATIFIFDWGFVAEGKSPEEFKETRIYKAGLRELPADCVARMFFERPELLRYFDAVLKTPRFTVLRIAFSQDE